MKIKILIVCLASGLLTLSQSAWAAGNSANARSHTTSFKPGYHARQAHESAALSEQAVSGVIPRLLHDGYPLQMLNPLAPAKYGTAQENVSMDPDVPGKANGINFFSISF